MSHLVTRTCAFAGASLLVACMLAACDDETLAPVEDVQTSPDAFEELDMSVCDLASGPFHLHFDNPYFPLTVGHRVALEGEDGGALLRVEVSVLDEVAVIAGVETRVVLEVEHLDGAIVEASRNYFAQAVDGTICYFGEDVDDYEGGLVVGHAGSWRAGEGDNQPGVLMPGSPRPETRFFQERAPGVAEDLSALIDVGVSFTAGGTDFDDVVRTVDWNPLEGQTSADGDVKVYARDIGLVFDAGVEVVVMELPAS